MMTEKEEADRLWRFHFESVGIKGREAMALLKVIDLYRAALKKEIEKKIAKQNGFLEQTPGAIYAPVLRNEFRKILDLIDTVTP